MGSTTRSLVIALRTDATGMSEGFQQAQAETLKYTEAVAAAQQRLQEVRKEKLPEASGEAELAALKMVHEERIAAAKEDLKNQRLLRDEAAATAKLEYDQERQRMILLDARVQKQIAGENSYRESVLQSQNVAMEAMRDQERMHAQLLEAKTGGDLQAEESSREASIQTEAVRRAALLETQQDAMSGFRSQEQLHAQLLEANVSGDMRAEEIRRTMFIQSQEVIASKTDAVNQRFERIQDLASVGMRPNFGQGFNPSEESGGFGGGHQMGQGWMMRMAGMDITRNVADMVAPGSGQAFGMAGYFAMGGGAMMTAIGGAMAGLGMMAAEVNDYRQGVKAARDDQVSLNEEIGKSALKWREVAEQTVKFDQAGEQARSMFSSTQSDAIDSVSAVQKAKIALESTYLFDAQEKSALAGAQNVEFIKLRAAEFMRVSLYGQDPSAFAGVETVNALSLGKSVSAIEQARSIEDVSRAVEEGQNRTADAAGIAAAQGMFPGRARDAAVAQADYAAKQNQLADKAIDDQKALARKWDDARRTLRSSAYLGHTDDLNYDPDQDPVYRQQLMATNLAMDLETRRTENEEKGAADRARIEHDAAMKRIDIDTQAFERQQANALNQAKIAGEFDPYERQLHNQMELNKEKHDEMVLAKATTDELAKQDAIGQQLIANIQVAHWREFDNRLKSLSDAAAVARMEMTPLEAERQQYLREHPGWAGKSEADRQMAAEKSLQNAQMELSIREKEIGIAERRGMIDPGMADFLMLSMEHPDVDPKLLRMMAMLDRIGSGELSTAYTAGQTNFGALYGNLGGGSGGGPTSVFGGGTMGAFGPPLIAGQSSAGFFNWDSSATRDFFNRDASPYASSDPMLSNSGTFSNPLIRSSNPFIRSAASMAHMTGTQSDNPAAQGNQIMRDIRTILKKIESSMN
jgi:hypothetical protein